MRKTSLFPFDTPALRRKIQIFRARHGMSPGDLTRTIVWSFSILTKGGKHWGSICPMDLFYADPEIPRHLLKESPVPNVLIVGTTSESRTLSKEDPSVTGTTMALVHDICLRHKLKGFNVIWSSEAGTFWENFFSNEDFLGGKVVFPPKLIVTTGSIRAHDCWGAGMTIDCLERLKEIGKNLNIPVETIQGSCL